MRLMGLYTWSDYIRWCLTLALLGGLWAFSASDWWVKSILSMLTIGLELTNMLARANAHLGKTIASKLLDAVRQ